MAVEIQAGVPCKIQAGDATIFQVTDSEHPATAWTGTIYFSRNGTPISNSASSANGTLHQFTLNGTVTNGLMGAMGKNSVQWMIRFTETGNASNIETGSTGSSVIIPNLSVTQTKSTAQTLLDALNTAIATVTANPYQTVSFNGQSVSFASLNVWLVERNRLMAEVQREQQALARITGQNDGSVYQVRFG